MKFPVRGKMDFIFVATGLAVLPFDSAAYTLPSGSVELASGWQLQDAGNVAQSGAEISSASFTPAGWYAATVPGTVLTSLVNDHVYPEPLYGENDRNIVIPDSLAHTSYWYRTTIEVPRPYKHRHVWLHFDGINCSAVVWGEQHSSRHHPWRFYPRDL